MRVPILFAALAGGPLLIAGRGGEEAPDRADATFEVRSWEEEPWDETQGSRLSLASVVKAYTGELEGEGTVRQLSCYRPDGSAVFTALERFRGRLGEREGSFVLRHEGTYDGGEVDATWTVVPGSATGGLEGLRGTIAFASGHAERYQVVFEHRFE